MPALAEKPEKVARVVPNAPWPLVPLGELAANEPASITDGPFGSKLKSAHYTESGPRVIRLQNIGEMVFVDAKAHISESHFDSLKRHRVFPDDLVIAALGENPPRACMIPDWLGPAIVKADCIRFKCGPRILPKFLLYALHQPELRRHAKGIIHGVGRPRLNLTEIKSLPIPVPPLPEQRRIVAEIEQQFTRLDAGVAALRRTQANLKRYRAAVLKAACEGRLVPSDTGWPIKPINAAIASLDQGWSPKCESEPSSSPETWAVIKTTAIQPLHFLEDENKSLPTALKPRPQLAIQSGDVLITRAGPRTRVGVACAVKSSRPRLILCDKAYRLRCKHDVATPTFIELVLNAPHVVDELDKLKTGISDSGLNLTQNRFRELQIPLPPLAKQTQIVADVERRLSVIEELESDLDLNILRSKNLINSILRNNFAQYEL